MSCIAYALLVLGLAGIGAWVGVTDSWDNASIFLWGAGLTLFFGGCKSE